MARSKVYEAVKEYQAISEITKEFILQRIRLYGAGEIKGDNINQLSKVEGVNIEISLSFESKRIGMEEIFLKEFERRSRVLLFEQNLTNTYVLKLWTNQTTF